MPGSQQYHEKLCLINYELAINVYDFKKLITKLENKRIAKNEKAVFLVLVHCFDKLGRFKFLTIVNDR